MFTPEERAGLRAALLEYAALDGRISGAAITGSAARDGEDVWSDIDLAFGVADAGEVASVLADFTALMYSRYSAVHHLDVMAGAWIYRVFLLASSLQVDLAFVPGEEFRATAPTFRLVSGRANEARYAAGPGAEGLIGMGWLYALHARSCLERGRLWQAEYMISGVRDQALALACVRHGLAAVHGRGFDDLPGEVTGEFAGSLAREVERAELWRAFRAAMAGLMREAELADGELSGRLRGPLTELTAGGPG